MKYILYIASMALFAFCISAIAAPEIAADTDADEEVAEDVEMAEKEMGGRVRGQVMRVNPSTDTLLIRSPNSATQIFTVVTNDATTYFGTASLKTINPGDYVTIDTFSSGDSYVAESISMEKRADVEEPLPTLEKVLSD